MNKNQDESEQVYGVFSSTIYGKRLAERARYDRFRPEWYPVKSWERLLGPDVNNLHHMRRTIKVARLFVKRENALNAKQFSHREARLLYVTAALHDQAEVIVGDVPYGRKSTDQRTWEIEVLKTYESSFTPRLSGPARTLYRIGRDRIAFGDQSEKLAGAFKTIELLGFMQNAFDAHRRLDQLSTRLDPRSATYLGITNKSEQQQLATALSRMVAEIMSSGVLGLLIASSERFPSVRILLRRHQHQISESMATITDDVFAWNVRGTDPGAAENDVDTHILHFNQQHALWQDWLVGVPPHK